MVKTNNNPVSDTWVPQEGSRVGNVGQVFELSGTATDAEGTQWGRYFRRAYTGRTEASATLVYVNLTTGLAQGYAPFVVTRKEEWREDYVTPFKGRLIPAHLHVERVTRSIRFKPVKCECCNRPAHRCAN